MCRTAGNGAIGQCAALCHICHIFKRNIITFYGDISCVQLAKVHYITFDVTSCQRIIAAFKRTKLSGAQLTRGNIQAAYIHPCIVSKQNAIRIDNINFTGTRQCSINLRTTMTGYIVQVIMRICKINCPALADGKVNPFQHVVCFRTGDIHCVGRCLIVNRNKSRCSFIIQRRHHRRSQCNAHRQ